MFRINKKIKGIIGLYLLIVPLDIIAQNNACEGQIKAFLHGKRLLFNTDSLPKAKGLVLKIECPKAWRLREGSNSGVVKDLVCDRLMSAVVIKILKSSQIDKMLKYVYGNQLIQTPKFRDVLINSFKIGEKNAGHKSISSLSYVELRNIKVLVYKANLFLISNNEHILYQENYIFFYDNYFVNITFSIGKSPLESEITFDQKINCFKRLIKLMVNTIQVEAPRKVISNVIKAMPETQVNNSLLWLYLAPFILFVYFLPLIIAILKKKKNFKTILIINLLFGMTIIGYFFSLILALKKNDPSINLRSETSASMNNSKTERSIEHYLDDNG